MSSNPSAAKKKQKFYLHIKNGFLKREWPVSGNPQFPIITGV
jgi:hypothetical protein